MGFLDRLYARLRRPKQPPVAKGHGGVVLDEGMWIRRHWDPKDRPKKITRIVSPTQVEVHFGDGVHDRVFADHYVPVGGRRRRRRRR